ncbi:hypothetical protein [Phenylobacterium sp. J367]|uniref:hypothetical protein n=1 Tax=Phenylobacterium sp. J367 TaxID=2898435 RepID=UPI00215072C1|nr:hypothetical protein [Phenylobacterium sp. J367]MCR5878304.1 hypothetical protein [Phenylobacterium sp. J367]
MGLSHVWVAVQGVGREAALEALGAEPVGPLEPDELPALGLGELPGGWLLVLSDDLWALERGPLQALTRMGPAVSCLEEEHVMASEARGYRDGEEIWRVIHNPEDQVEEASGELPAAYTTLREEAERLDALYDVGPQLAQSICGFKLDQDFPLGLVFTELRSLRRAEAPRSASRKPGFFQRLFGRK